MRLGLALKAFFSVLGNRETANRVQAAIKPLLLESKAAPVAESKSSPSKLDAKEPVRGRSEALTLISTLQREARFLDLVQEPLDGYTDAQIGSAARDVLRDTSKTLKRLFGIEKLVDSPEGERIELPGDLSTARWRVVGPTPNGNKASLIHAGWQATHCDVPQWNGPAKDALVLSPAEVEA